MQAYFSSFYCLTSLFRKVRVLYSAHFIIMIKKDIPFLKKRFALGDCVHFLLLQWFNFNVHKISYNELVWQFTKAVIHRAICWWQHYENTRIREPRERSLRTCKVSTALQVDNRLENNNVMNQTSRDKFSTQIKLHCQTREILNAIKCITLQISFSTLIIKSKKNKIKSHISLWRAASNKTEAEGIIGDWN